MSALWLPWRQSKWAKGWPSFPDSGNGNELEKRIESKGCVTHFDSAEPLTQLINFSKLLLHIEKFSQQFVIFFYHPCVPHASRGVNKFRHTFFTPCRMSFFPVHKNDGWFTVSRDHSLPQWRNFSSRPAAATGSQAGTEPYLTLLHCCFACATRAFCGLCQELKNSNKNSSRTQLSS